MNRFIRSELLIGKESIEKLSNSRVAVFGVGGVGGAALEALARAGVGHFDLIDNDVVTYSNFNRQLIATEAAFNKKKAEVAKDRVLSINPKADVKVHPMFILKDNIDEIDFSSFNYIVEAVDTVTAKIAIIRKAKELNIPLISAMGCGNRIDPTKVTFCDISETKDDHLARVMRRTLKTKYGITSLNVVYSTEHPFYPYLEKKEIKVAEEVGFTNKKQVPGSTPFVPLAAGNLIAYHVVLDLTGFDVEGTKRRQDLIREQRHHLNKAENKD